MTEKYMIKCLSKNNIHFVKKGKHTVYFVTSLGMLTFDSLEKAFLTFCEDDIK
jgi:hypothetical protein